MQHVPTRLSRLFPLHASIAKILRRAPHHAGLVFLLPIEYPNQRMSKKIPQAYQDLQEFSTSIHIYNSILTLLQWDQETYMPPGGITPRSQQIAQLSEHIHNLKSSRK